MKSPVRRLALMTLAMIFVTATAFAQFTAKKIWILTIAVNAPNAVCWVDNEQVPPGNQARVAGGPHNVKVHADGYADFIGPVVVTGNQTFTVNLQMLQPSYPLTIRVNVPDAVVILDGADVTGMVPSVFAGSHTVQVTANGYRDYNTVLNVNGAMAIDVVLQSAGFLLTVNVNVANATVSVNNMMKGPAPFSMAFGRGTYTVRVSAPGFVDYLANVALDRPINLNVQLQPLVQPSTLSVVIPPALMDPDVRQGDERAQVRIFVDNRLVNRGKEADRIVVQPGPHRIRVSSGAFSVQLGDLMVQPGMSYIIEVGMDLKVRAMKAGQQ
jgi:hypothetical protein